MRKKRWIMVLGVMAAGIIMTGCGQSAQGTAQEVDSSEGEEITLRFLSWQSNHAQGDQRILDAWEKEHPDIKVEIEYIGDMSSKDYLQKTDLMLMGGEEIDIVMAPTMADVSVRAMSNSYLPMDEFLRPREPRRRMLILLFQDWKIKFIPFPVICGIM